MRARTQRTIRIIAIVTILSAFVGWSNAPRTPTGAAVGLVSGAIIGLLITIAEIHVRSRWADAIRRMPVAAAFLTRSAAYAIILITVPLVVGSISDALSGQPGDISSVFAARGLALSAAFSLAVNFVLILRGLLGPRVLTSLVTGRYHQPQDENRIVLFLDLVGSTRIAESIGDKQFLRLLNRIFFDATDAVIEAGGEIYRYVGDEIIVTWPFPAGPIDPACLTCVFAIEDAIARHKQHYLGELGVEPMLRGALHAGHLIVGEMGDVKREIVMLGDTMNTAAKIVDVCRRGGRRYIVSAALLDRIAAIPAGIRAQTLGSVAIPGKETGMVLFVLERESKPQS